MIPVLFLLDIDCFFASVEMALHPELRGRPVCVGGRRGGRGIVTCPNYEARAYGVRTAMPVRTAERMLPSDAVFLHGNHHLYGEYSERVMEILESFTPDVEQVSIDEAYMDVTGCLHFWGHDPRRMAAAMKDRIWRQCGLSVSVGIAAYRMCAKIAAGKGKPDGLVMVEPGRERDFLLPLPVEDVPGIGPKTAPRLYARGIRTVADFLRCEGAGAMPGGLAAALGEACGLQRHVRADRVERSISRDTTFDHDTMDRERITATLYTLVERCCKTLRAKQQKASTVTVKVRSGDFTTVQRQATLSIGTAREEEIFAAARHLLDAALPPYRFVRLVGVKVSGIEDATAQMSLDMDGGAVSDELHRRIDALQARYGAASIRWGITAMPVDEI